MPNDQPAPLVQFVHTLLRARDWQERPEFTQMCDWWRAWLGDETGAEADLREVETIATRSGLRLCQTDLHLLRARLYATRNPALAREHLAQARALVHDTSYHRRDAEIAVLEHALGARTEP